jgi:hypothetical protein
MKKAAISPATEIAVKISMGSGIANSVKTGADA